MSYLKAAIPLRVIAGHELDLNAKGSLIKALFSAISGLAYMLISLCLLEVLGEVIQL